VKRTLATLALALAIAAAATPSRAEEQRKISLEFGKYLDASAIAYDLARSFLTEDEWRQHVHALRGKFEDWEETNGGDMGRYLNDRIVIVALSAVGGEAEKIKKGIIWLAFYKEFNQQPPNLVLKAFREHKNSLTQLFQNFSWERASQYIKKKEWRTDIEERRKKKAEVKAAEDSALAASTTGNP